MKKVIITLACMLTFGAMQAQEKEKKFFMEAKVGMENFINYSAVSVFSDETANYCGGVEEINFGYRSSKNFAFELSLFMGGMFTSDITNNEYFHNNGLCFGFREYFSISEHSEFYYGVRMGMIYGRNTLNYQANDYKISRIGIKTQFVTGYNYHLSSKSYIGMSVNLPISGAFSNAYDMPTELSNFPANQRTGFFGFSINVGWGFKF